MHFPPTEDNAAKVSRAPAARAGAVAPLVMGVIIGSAIFIVPAQITSEVGSAGAYRVWGYPVVPIIFVLAAGGLVVNTLIERPVEAGWGAALLALGVPVYLFRSRRLRSAPSLGPRH